MSDPASDGSGYRVGALDTPLHMFVTAAGDVYVDPDGGGQILAEDCAAAAEYVRSNGMRNHAVSCLDGMLPEELLER